METPEGISKEELLAAVDDASTREKEVVSAHAQLASTLGRLKEECRKEIRSLIPPDELGEYEKYHERAKQRLADLSGMTQHTTEALKLSAQARRRIVTEGRRFVQNLDINTKQIEEVQRRFLTRAQSAVEEALRGGQDAPYVETSPGEAPTRSHNPWEWRSPPYAGQWGTGSSYGTAGSRSVSHFENSLTGEIDCWSYQSIYGADDSDTTYTNAYSEVQFWFRMPAAGLVEVWLYLQAIDTPYGGCLDDEWGWSDADIIERSRPYLWILSPYGSPRYATLLEYHRGEDEGCWSSVTAAAGQFRYAHLFSFDSYAANQYVLCGVGIQDYNYFWVNDMSCSTNLTNRWFLKDVAVRSTGAP
jgi:hypothetical protein